MRPALALSIAAVERDTGIGKDTLRAWERRYGFPTPTRDSSGERAYTLDQVDRLRTIKRLLDAGHRPGQVVALASAQLQRLANGTPKAPAVHPAQRPPEDAVPAYLALLRRHDTDGLHQRLVRDLLRLGLMRCLAEVLTPLTRAVGDAWMRGGLQIFEEHLYTVTVQQTLEQWLAAVPAAPAAEPRVLLATVSGEPHGLGLLMAHCVLQLEGARCWSLGVQTPAQEIARAATTLDTAIVALSFTGCSKPHQITHQLEELRAALPPPTALWVGGSAPVLERRPVDGVRVFNGLDALPPALQAWRSDRDP